VVVSASMHKRPTSGRPPTVPMKIQDGQDVVFPQLSVISLGYHPRTGLSSLAT
ncbi:hypothetical protein FRC19_007600, partial [Serendipita sp. 401]